MITLHLKNSLTIGYSILEYYIYICNNIMRKEIISVFTTSTTNKLPRA